MTGICGSVGELECNVDQMKEFLKWTGQESHFDFTDDNVQISVVRHPNISRRQPFEASGENTLLWLTGSVYGVKTELGYEPRDPNIDELEFCARLYNQYGVNFVRKLNGTFTCILYEQSSNTLSVLSDRLGTYPIFFVRGSDKALTFSTHIQSFAAIQSIDLEIHPDYLSEYCSSGRVNGLKTPFKNVEQFPPGSITRIDLDQETFESHQYWRPEHDPIDEPFSYFVDQFTSIVGEIMEERFEDDKLYGLLVSGGSDSRLLAAAAPEKAVVYHLSDWMSEEARTAERVAMTAGLEFHWLQRGSDYQEKVFHSAPKIMNFNGRFEQAHIAGYLDRLRDEVDVLVSGLWADVLFNGLALERRKIDVGSLTTIGLPFAKPLSRLEEVISLAPDYSIPYLTYEKPIREILRSNISQSEDGSVVDHGVEYPSLDDFLLYQDMYPLSNDPDAFFWCLEQAMPHWTPFLDNRLIDLGLQMPIRYQLRRNVVNQAVKRLNPELARIPLVKTGVRQSRPYPVHILGEKLKNLEREVFGDDSPPQPFFTHHPWTSMTEMLLHHPFPEKVLRDHKPLIERASFLDWEGTQECFRDHTDQKSWGRELYLLLTLLNMPIVNHVINKDMRARSDETDKE